MDQINLGDKVRDTVTGASGIFVCETKWLHGCTRMTIQPALDKDGKVPETHTFDRPQAELVSKKGAVNDDHGTQDGPHGDPSFVPRRH